MTRRAGRSRSRTWAGTRCTRPRRIALWRGIADGERFYFVHSYFVVPEEPDLEARPRGLRVPLYLRGGAG